MDDKPQADPRRAVRRCDPTLPPILGQHEASGAEFHLAKMLLDGDPRPVIVEMGESTPLRQPTVAIRQEMERRARRRADGGHYRSPGFNIFRGG